MGCFVTVTFTARCPNGHEATWTATTTTIDGIVDYQIDCPCRAGDERPAV